MGWHNVSVSMQNIYDDEVFFAGYQAMRDARSGINEAVKQPAFLALLPPLDDAVVVDLGCGDGQLCRVLVDKGAKSVLGVDHSARMFALAEKRTVDDRVRYLKSFAEQVTLPASSVDLVTSSLALHYVADLPPLLERLATWLRPGGWFVASMEHPVVTAAPELGSHPCIVDNYASEGERDTTWYVEGVVKYHRRISTIINGVIDAGLAIRRVIEPTPTTESLVQRPNLDHYGRLPAVLILAATKPLPR